MKFFLLLSLSLSFTAMAEVGPEQVDGMLQQMVRENVISKEDADKARTRMKSMSAGQWSEVNKQAKEAASRMPASENIASRGSLSEVNAIDLDSEQFKAIQNDLKKIVPQYKD